MLQETALVDAHKRAGGKLVDFGGWNMPLHYGSQIQEHHVVRTAVGMFDVSHMTVVDVTGSDVTPFLRRLLANDVSKIEAKVGKALYSGMLNHEAGVIDDLIVYRMPDGYRLIVNCATREKDLAWIGEQATGYSVEIKEREEFAMIAVQGPKAERVIAGLFDSQAVNALGVFYGQDMARSDAVFFVARTGYTGEDGFEILLPSSLAEGFWQDLLDAGVEPCGLGARDTLRLEAGMNLYGHEMDETISPLLANMAWTVSFADESRDFIGRVPLQQQLEAGLTHKLVGLIMKGKGVLRAGQEVICSGKGGSGLITSGTFSPSLGISIALARVPVEFLGKCHALVRGRELSVEIVQPCFIRKGKKVF
ncbi:MAG: aminomethyltransferase [Flavobacteriales bacterium]|jgi:aminomethyltransferase